ncbi:MAG: L,D-transpeptidase [Bacillota bacterium]|nr:L,D-transpeptidase [Bacillota bacterium]
MKRNLLLLIVVQVLLVLLLILVQYGRDTGAWDEDSWWAAAFSQQEEESGAQGNAGAEEGAGTEAAEEELPLEEEPRPGDVLSVETEILEPGFPVELLYTRYQLSYTYFVAEGTVALWESPSAEAARAGTAQSRDKLSYVETVQVAGAEEGSTETWYHVKLEKDGESCFGFVRAGDALSRRSYRFDQAEAAVEELDALALKGGLAHIGNYKNYKGMAPKYKGSSVDAAGVGRSQAAPAYPSLSDLTEFSYLEDGTLLRLLDTVGEYGLVTVLYTGKSYYVPLRYVDREEATLQSLERVIVVDRENQNQMVYEKRQGSWTLISCTLATTGTSGPYSSLTPLGYYYAMEKRSQFYYYKDGTTEIQGYAPYVIRFSGGGYVHGVGVNYQYDSAGNRITPGHVEYSSSIGTVPLSHKCVRNYTSHAKFLYDRYETGTTAVVVIE